MPAERFDAIVIGATVEGLGCALSLALSGKKVICADKQPGMSDLGRDKAVWLKPAVSGQLGLAGHGLAFGALKPQMAIIGGARRLVWPDLEWTHRALEDAGPGVADRFVGTIRFLQRQAREISEPGAALRGALAAGAFAFAAPWNALELGQFIARDVSSLLSERVSDPALEGLLSALAALHAPITPDALASAPALLNVGQYFHAPGRAVRPAFGGERAAIRALASALTAAGGQIAFASEIREILIERETAAGVALSDGRVWHAPVVAAAIAPRRLAQGLLSTRRSGRQLTALASTPRDCVALAAFAFGEPPLEAIGGARAFPEGAAIWLGVEPERVRDQAYAYQDRRIVPEPVICLDLTPGEHRAVVTAPLVPPEPAEGPWTDGRRRALLDAMIRTLSAYAPSMAASLEEAEILTPREPEQLGGTGAIFGGGARLPDLETMFGLRGEPLQPLLKGLYLCAAFVLEPDLSGGLAAAQAIVNASQSKLRA